MSPRHYLLFATLALACLSLGASCLSDSSSDERPRSREKAQDKPAPPDTRLYARLGGRSNIALIVSDWIDRSLNNPKVNLTRVGTPRAWQATPEAIAALKERYTDFVSAACGADSREIQYKGRSMKEAHQGMGITNAQFEESLNDLRQTLAKFQVSPTEQTDLLQVLKGARADIVETAPTPVVPPGRTDKEVH